MGFPSAHGRPYAATANDPLSTQMSARIRILFLVALVPSALAGQSHPFPLAADRLRLGSDTIEFVPTGERTPNMASQDAWGSMHRATTPAKYVRH